MMNNKSQSSDQDPKSPPPTRPRRPRQGRKRRNGFKTQTVAKKLDITKREKNAKKEFNTFKRVAKQQGIEEALDLYLITKGHIPKGGTKATLERRKIMDKLKSSSGSKTTSGGKSDKTGDSNDNKNQSNYISKFDKGVIFSDEDNSMEEEELDDCFSSEEEDETEHIEIRKSRLIINPEGKFKYFWDHLNILMVLYVAIFAPLKFSFFDNKDYPLWDYLEMAVDFFFFVDLILNFFTPIYINYKLELNHLSIAKEYLKFWFWLDFLSIFPFQILLNGVADYSIFLKVARLPRLWKVLRAAKLLRTFRVARKSRTCMGKLIYYIRSRNFLAVQLVPLYIFTLSCAHIQACLWHLISLEAEGQESWLVRFGYSDEGVWERYWASLYYTYTTMTTTGYGDITPDTTPEKMFTLVIMVFGVILYSWIYSMMMDAIKEGKERYEVFEIKKNQMKELKGETKNWKEIKEGKKINLFKKNEKVYNAMMNEIKMHQEDHLMEKENRIRRPKLNKVKPQDKTKLMLEVLDKEYGFTKLAFFKGLEQSGSRKDWLHFFEFMERRVFDKGEMIFESGRQANEFYVIRSGAVWFLLKEEDIDEKELCIPQSKLFVDQHLEEKSKMRRKSSGFFQKILFWRKRRKSSIVPKNQIVVKNLPFMEVNSYFGEFELFDSSLRWWTVMAKRKTVAYVIKKNDFLKIFEDEAQRVNFFKKFSERLQEFKLAEEETKKAISAFDIPDSQRFEELEPQDESSGSREKENKEIKRDKLKANKPEPVLISKFSNRMSLAPNKRPRFKTSGLYGRTRIKRSVYDKQIELKEFNLKGVDDIGSSSSDSDHEDGRIDTLNLESDRNYIAQHDSHREPLKPMMDSEDEEPEVVVYNVNTGNSDLEIQDGQEINKIKLDQKKKKRKRSSRGVPIIRNRRRRTGLVDLD